MGELAQGVFFREDCHFPEKRLRSFIPSCFIVCPLPLRSMEKGEKEYVKRFNNFELKLTGSEGIPGGKIARDLLMLFTTEAVYRKNYEKEKITLNFESLSDLQKRIGMNTVVHGDRVLDMIKKFTGCTLSFKMELNREIDGQTLLFENELFRGVKGEKGSRLNYKNITNVPFINKIETIDLMKEKNKRGEPLLIELTLMSEFVEMVRNNAVPVDFTVYSDIQGAMTQDLYVWLVYKNYKNWTSDEVFIPKNKLVEQFGTEGGSNENLKYARILEALEMIRKDYYTSLKYRVIDNGKRKEKGILLYRSQMPVSEQNIKYVPLLTKI